MMVLRRVGVAMSGEERTFNKKSYIGTGLLYGEDRTPNTERQIHIYTNRSIQIRN